MQGTSENPVYIDGTATEIATIPIRPDDYETPPESIESRLNRMEARLAFMQGVLEAIATNQTEVSEFIGTMSGFVEGFAEKFVSGNGGGMLGKLLGL